MKQHLYYSSKTIPDFKKQACLFKLTKNENLLNCFLFITLTLTFKLDFILWIFVYVFTFLILFLLNTTALHQISLPYFIC